jgi:hypothetical protein
MNATRLAGIAIMLVTLAWAALLVGLAISLVSLVF